MKIEYDSESDYDEEKEGQVLNYELQEDDIVMSEAMHLVYGTDNYEWNQNNKPKGEVCNFSKGLHFSESFRYTLPVKNNMRLNPFLPMAQNYEPGLQPIDGLYQTLLCGLRHGKTGEYLHTFDFSCIDEDLLSELEKIKKQVEYCHTISIFESKLHLINDILMNYGFF